MWALTADLLPYGIRRRRLAAALAILVVGAFLAGCNSIIGNGGPTAAVLGGEAKRTPGQGGIDTEEHSRIVAAYGGIYHDAKVEQTLIPIVSRIVAASDRPDQAYRITILNAPAINAFALPGGYLYVTRGLLEIGRASCRERVSYSV